VQFAGNVMNSAPPEWLRVEGMSTQTVKADIISIVSLVAGGSFGDTFIGPNSVGQFATVNARIKDIETDQFIQECMLQMPANAVLATLAYITDRHIANATPLCRVILPPRRLVFA
jgi:hypothetical protein